MKRNTKPQHILGRNAANFEQLGQPTPAPLPWTTVALTVIVCICGVALAHGGLQTAIALTALAAGGAY